DALQGVVEPVRGGALPLARGRAGPRAAGARGHRADRGRRDYGRASPRARSRGHAVPPGERADAGTLAAPRELPLSGAAAMSGIRAAELLERVLAGHDLDEDRAAALLRALAAGEVEPAVAGALLIALRQTGEAASEIRGFALAMRALARRPEIPPGEYVDIVGTGGDRSGSLNLSTGAALLAAACGAPIVKHGNRSISSRSGSADVLTALGLPIPLAEAAAGSCLESVGFTFLFAPHYHPP